MKHKKLKICGMKYEDNMKAVSELQPDYLGFIFYKKSSRFFNTVISEIPKEIKKTGVFVNTSIEDILKKGALRAREYSVPFLNKIRKSVGIQSLC